VAYHYITRGGNATVSFMLAYISGGEHMPLPNLVNRLVVAYPYSK